jgi:hypothetical protein
MGRRKAEKEVLRVRVRTEPPAERIQLLRRLGKGLGRFSQVYLASGKLSQDDATELFVVKRIQRFGRTVGREVEVLLSIKHPNIVSLLRPPFMTKTADGRLFMNLCFPYFRGSRTLGEAIRAQPGVSEAQLSRVTREVRSSQYVLSLCVCWVARPVDGTIALPTGCYSGHQGADRAGVNSRCAPGR